MTARDAPFQRKRPIAVAKQDGDVVGALIGDGQVELTVAIEVAHGDTDRQGADRKVPRLLKRAVPETQKHRNIAGVYVRGDQVGHAVAVEIAHGAETRRQGKGIIGGIVGLHRLVRRRGRLELSAQGIVATVTS